MMNESIETPRDDDDATPRRLKFSINNVLFILARAPPSAFEREFFDSDGVFFLSISRGGYCCNVAVNRCRR